MKQLEDLFSVFPRIETERLMLRQHTPEDAADCFACYADPEVFKYSPLSEETSLQSATHTLNRLLTWHIVNISCDKTSCKGKQSSVK